GPWSTPGHCRRRSRHTPTSAIGPRLTAAPLLRTTLPWAFAGASEAARVPRPHRAARPSRKETIERHHRRDVGRLPRRRPDTIWPPPAWRRPFRDAAP